MSPIHICTTYTEEIMVQARGGSTPLDGRTYARTSAVGLFSKLAIEIPRGFRAPCESTIQYYEMMRRGKSGVSIEIFSILMI